MKGKLSKGITVGPAEEAFPIDLFGFYVSGFAVEVLDWLHE